MNSNTFETRWNQLKELILIKWNKLTEDDLRQISGRFDQFIAKLQQRYGYTREEAEEEVRNWAPSLKAESVGEAREAGLPKWLPWVLVGIPLLLLLSYFGNREVDKVDHATTAPRAAEERYATHEDMVADETITTNFRTALSSIPQLVADLRNLRVETVDGVLTIHGTVSTTQQKDLISSLARRIPNIKQVDNQLEVRQ